MDRAKWALLWRIGCVIWLVLLSQRAPAQPLQGHQAAEQTEIKTLEVTQHRLALGAMENVNGRWRAEKEIRVDGRLTQQTFRLGAEEDPAEVHQFALAQLQQQQFLPLFACQGRECGSSNRWANQIFHNRFLYGPDTQQTYWIGERLVDGQRQIALLYTIVRGNKRIYSHYQRLDLQADTSPASLSTHQRQWNMIDGLSFHVENDRLIWKPDAKARLVQQLARLGRDKNQRLALVGHWYGSQPLAQLETLSHRYAELVAAALAAEGVQIQWHIRGVGPLAPRHSPPKARVEWVRLP